MMMDCPRCWRQGGPCDKCEGTGRIPDVKLADNFTLQEFLESSTAREKRIPNDPTSLALQRIRDTAQLIQKPRNEFGRIDITSGYRSPPLNRALPNASLTSAHVLGWAADIRPRYASLLDLMHWFWDSTLAFDQVILEPNWVHVGLRRPGSGQQRRQFLQFQNGKYSLWEPGT